MAGIVFGSFSPLTLEKKTVKAKRLVPGTATITKMRVETVPVNVMKEVSFGCSDRCGGLCAYTKTSLRRAIKEGDLTSSGACHHCGLHGLVGEGRPRTQLVPFLEYQQKEVSYTEVVQTMVEEEYEMEVPVYGKIFPIEEVASEATRALSVTTRVTVEAKMMATEKPSIQQVSGKLRRQSAIEIAQYNAQIAAMDEFLQKNSDLERRLFINKYSPVQQKKSGAVCIRHLTYEQAMRRKERHDKEKEADKKFWAGEYEVKVDHVQLPTTLNTSGQVGFRSEFYTRTYKQRKVPQQVKNFIIDKGALDKVLRLAKQLSLPIEFIGKRRQQAIKATFVKRGTNTLPQVYLPHADGIYKNRELNLEHVGNTLSVLCKHAKMSHLKDEQIKRGDSGLVFDERSQITRDNTAMPYFVIRGRCNGKLVNALDFIKEKESVVHYSQTPEAQFFAGWKKVFDRMVPHIEPHTCTVDFANAQCGEVAATISQTLFPVRKLSCLSCRKHLQAMSWEGYKQFLAAHLDYCSTILQEKDKALGFELVEKLVLQVTKGNTNLESSMEIVRLTQNYTTTPMLQVQDINKALMKGSSVTQQELDQATKQLLEMTRWWKKHMNLTDEDALRVFRNKRSSKALLNPSLLCDNQLDRNGNFVWGERGKHSKRFFANFFEEVVPSGGYGKYVVRRNPNGQRKLAIGSLIVPLDFDRARLALQGESITRESLTMACISRQNNNFVYPCCCVTHDDGTPLYSDLKSPTKRHLVVGSSGDPKYIDLPAEDTDRMYIAKEGYCYLNIFLAMLVNVNEQDAKDFTKMVRDVIVPRLGKWPSMMDVATAAYILTVFHPETRNAELPRILVDHAAQTMHVVDSFGSLTVGYHILKAGTISQLIQFASNDLLGEMKFYKVGGMVEQRMKCETALISSIFKPKRMIQILEDDPYILLLGMISPSVLIHMYRMRHFEKGVQTWISKNQNVTKIFIIMEQLTKKLAVNDILLDQLQIISGSSGHLLELLVDCPSQSHSYKPALDLLSQFLERDVTNKQLSDNGFVDINENLYVEMEKIYVERLKQEWHALSLLEKSFVTWQLKKFSPVTERSLTEKVAEEKEESSKFFVSACFMNAQSHLRNARISLSRKCEEMYISLIRKCVGVLLRTVHRCYSDILYLINVCIVFSLLVQMSSTLHGVIKRIQVDRAVLHRMKQGEEETTLVHMYELFTKAEGGIPTMASFTEHVKVVRPDLLPTLMKIINQREDVSCQAKTPVQCQFEKIVAFMALLTMCIDTERSDAIFKILNKLKVVFSTMGEDVKIQSLDEIEDIEVDKKLTIDFDLETNKEPSSVSFDVKFDEWWNRQLNQNRVVPHYRTTGEFMEFTRETAAKVANQISISSATEFLVRGAVGSGKSTGLPHHLAKKGKVLLLEPTRPLAENVSKQLNGEPFYQMVTLRMRGLNKFGSSNITVMTSGFAFHYYVNNPNQLADFDFIIIDECHVLDSATIAFNCALKEYEFAGKLIKISATPPGRECEFTTQHPVKLKMEDQISFQHFVSAQGTGSNADMIQHGHNILVYVASYNEVDQLSRLLIERQFKVTKVDGRTMQKGNVEIVTSGIEGKPHFIVATNIIENGVTIDVDCVVDFGQKVVAVLDSDCRCVRYNKKPVTYGERIQRLGRVGRCKPGFALRIGHTEKGVEEIPEFIATEAAFLSFAYGLPVTTQSVTTSILSRCTTKQARNALNFELTPFFSIHFIKYDGSMHPEIHRLLKPFKLRESEMLLNKLAIPYQYVNQWLTVREYDRQGIHVHCNESARIPFYAHGIPDKLYEALWDTICKYKGDAGFGRVSSASAAKISYTLSTDPSAVPRTIAIIDHLLSEEMMKKNHFDTIGSSVTGYSFSLAGIAEGFRKRYMRDYTQQNIAILQQAKAQLLEFDSTKVDLNNLHGIEGIGVLNAVQLQSTHEVCKFLNLKGKWDGKKFMNDALVGVFALIGGGWMMWEYFTKKMKEPVSTQGKKRILQKLKFRDAYDRKMGREVYADDYTMERTFGEAYTKRGKRKGSTETRGMGRKTRNFIHMYGVEPENYSMIRFVDPITGHTMDENPRVDIRIVQEEFGDIRMKMIEEDKLDTQHLVSRPGLQAYLFGKNTEDVLKVDLTPHIPTLLCQNTNAISGFPEREDELRQTGPPVRVSKSEVPEPNEHVELESKSVYKGLRDYSAVATLICQLTNASDGHKETLYGIGYGAYIITNGHLFRRNNGILTVRTWHGEFVINNTTQLKIHFIEGKDAILIRMPKDFPPFAKRSFFRQPVKEERVCMVGTNFQEKSLRATVSESSIIVPEGVGSFWIHWISTQDGFCGLPLVSVNDGFIVGFHGLKSNDSDKNFFIPFIDDFEKKYLRSAESLSWDKHWFWQPDKIAWGSLNLVDEQPREEFKISKLISDLFSDSVVVQSQRKRERWVLDNMEGNLVACGQADSALVTKHVVKGRCPHFEQYLIQTEEAAKFFRPLMGAYQPSKLNREAFKKDFFKYNKPIVLNEVDFDAFEKAIDGVKCMMMEYGFHDCTYVTDPDEIFGSLNMKAAVGAQYKGKKSEYLEGMDSFDKERLLYLSSERLFYGKKGLWNGSLKAELRPKEKVQANKTRTFTAAPIDTLLGAKVCVDDFNNQFYSLNLACPWTVGMTKFYGGWDKLMRSLPDGWLYCHADGSQFDSSLTPLLLNAVLDIRRFFMEEWWVGQEMLENLYAEIVYTPILAPDGTIFKKFRGNNSGQPSTVVDNTLMVVLAMYYSCYKQGWTEDDLEDRIIFFANGDDIILAVKEEDAWIYDTLSASFAELGLNYNFDDRSKRREDLWFMSHTAIEIDGVYIPKLEPERIVSILEWDRSKEIMHRTEAICAAMIEAWGYTDLLREIRKFYLWLVQKDEFKELAAAGKAPYIAETALRKLYMDKDASMDELQKYLHVLDLEHVEGCCESVSLQTKSEENKDELGKDAIDAGNDGKRKDKEKEGMVTPPTNPNPNNPKFGGSSFNRKDRDVDAGSKGKMVPRLQKITKKMNLPTVKGRVILDLDHLLEYAPNQVDLFNTRATKSQFESWYSAVQREYELDDNQMSVIMNGFMVWCIDNGTSPNVNGTWVMMDGEEQIEYPLKPLVENAQPTLRQIMHHFSDAAEAYIEMRNSKEPYMPRYGTLRNLRDLSLARYAFDFYEVTSKTPNRAREAVAQMKAAALANVSTRLFGLDGNVSTTGENTERHTARDVNQNMHTLLGMNSPQ
uniref:Genome polyprotein n=1 Tax=East Asian Passiflora virus TaxID=341167 RepID=I7GSE4_9POTV|nr:polyprotein [East Asian Passiflora virus]